MKFRKMSNVILPKYVVQLALDVPENCRGKMCPKCLLAQKKKIKNKSKEKKKIPPRVFRSLNCQWVPSRVNTPRAPNVSPKSSRRAGRIQRGWWIRSYVCITRRKKVAQLCAPEFNIGQLETDPLRKGRKTEQGTLGMNP